MGLLAESPSRLVTDAVLVTDQLDETLCVHIRFESAPYTPAFLVYSGKPDAAAWLLVTPKNV